MAISVQNFNPMVAVQAGATMAQGMVDAERKARAYNALREIYGDVAGDPQSNAMLFNTRAAQQKLPGQLEQQALQNQGLAQTNEFNALANPERLTGLRLGNEGTAQTQEFARQRQPGVLQRDQQTLAQGEQALRQGERRERADETKLGDDRAERERTAAQGILAAVKERVSRGEDPAAAFDAVAPSIAAMENVDPAQLRSLRDSFVRDPAGTIKAMEDYIGSARPNTALMQAQAGQTRAEAARVAAEARAKGKSKAEGSPDAKAFIQGARENVLRVLDDVEKDTGNVSTNTLARSIYGKANDFKMGFSETETRYLQNLESLRVAMGVEALAARRNSGLSFGQITEREFDRIAASVSRLEGIRNPETVATEVKRIRRDYEKVLALAEKEAGSTPAPAAAPGGSDDAAARRKALLDKYR